ncbi:9580_t:CDS:2 [Acaulospora morrowiae]|uniref:9580_t:CDS:1 n=1 Tax=Acaulospora morrowiae TaxID=94023 RepID=A0A9N9CZQ7_9GLOM|nr:9580_t:CDS:2 [Acaulospora morrowiae]
MATTSTRSNFHDLTTPDSEGLEEVGLLNTALVYNLNYKTWEFYRRFYTRSILKSSFNIQAADCIQEAFREMENYWEQLGEGTILEFPRWIKRFFTDTTFLMAASKPTYSLASYYNSLSTDKKVHIPANSLKESDTFIRAIDDFITCFLYFLLLPKYLRELPGLRGYTNNLKKRVEWLKNNVRGIIKERREEIEKTPEDHELTHDLLTMFITINTSRDITEKIADSLHDRPMTDEEICGNFMELLSGGIDTSSNSICYIIYYLSHYPKVKEKFIEEIDRVVGKDTSHKVTNEGVGKLEYCEAVINECSRIFSIVPSVCKRNTRPDEIGGMTFPADTQFFTYLQGIHKHKSQWADPEEFNPERFMGRNSAENKKHLYTFGIGLRKCPGRNLAMLELKLTLALLYRKYDVELVDMNAPIKYHTTMVRTCDELKVRIKKRKV